MILIRIRFPLLFLSILLFLVGCQKTASTQPVHWSATKEEALSHYKEQLPRVNETYLELMLTTGESVVLVQRKPSTYAIGEFYMNQGQYAFDRTSAWVAMGNTTGAMWAFTTKAGTDYKLKIAKSREDTSSFYNKALGVYMTVSEGDREYNDKNVTNLIAAASNG
ncbi:hypothetical protein [Cohnella soli]|uniref:DUF4367 domain-containing protein n=1 Tax=Cohnella soli TaxID=425005 RepID=A0ABW0HZ46_9BACL